MPLTNEYEINELNLFKMYMMDSYDEGKDYVIPLGIILPTVTYINNLLTTIKTLEAEVNKLNMQKIV